MFCLLGMSSDARPVHNTWYRFLPIFTPRLSRVGRKKQLGVSLVAVCHVPATLRRVSHLFRSGSVLCNDQIHVVNSTVVFKMLLRRKVNIACNFISEFMSAVLRF